MTWTRTKEAEFQGHRLVPLRPRVALARSGRGEEWIETLDRDALAVRVTSLEPTLVDVLDRPSLAGGMEEVWRSLAALPAVDPVALLDDVRVLRNKTVAARVGYFLESRHEELAVPSSTLDALQDFLAGHPVHMERALGGRLHRRWRLFVPVELAGPPEEADATLLHSDPRAQQWIQTQPLLLWKALNVRRHRSGASGATGSRPIPRTQGPARPPETLRRLPAWQANARKRLVHSPRVFLRDSGLVMCFPGGRLRAVAIRAASRPVPNAASIPAALTSTPSAASWFPSVRNPIP